MSDLFSHHREATLRRIAPLADRMRPRSIEEFAGQEAILGPGRLLRRAIAADRVGNLILHGPPGTGKTTLARIIAGSTRAHFSSLNAVLAGVKDLRAEVDAARQRLEHHGLRTILFIDEVHRFNTAQQDALLPWVENGTVTLIGATTENPFFEVNKALVSRSRLFRLQPLQPADLRQLLERAIRDPERGYGERSVVISPEAADHLIDVAGGDARSLLNALELAVETTEPDDDGVIRIDLAIAEESIQQRAVLYDKQGDAHFDTISAFIKSLRGSDADAALFWLARMVEAGENPRFIFRRMLIAAGEDVGLADPQAMVVVEACAAAFDRVGLPEGLYPLAHAALYLAATEKSNSSLGFFDALRSVRTAADQRVPPHLRDANRDGKAFGDGVGYRYPHAYAEHWVAQQYLPSALQGEVFWQPGPLGWEGGLRARLQQRRAAQLAAAAETELDQPELLSSAPDDPQLERWLRRQAAAEGERLEGLRQRFWQPPVPGRLDRVLVLEARSLLWALDPLQQAREGEVVIAVPDQQQLARLEAQLQILDQLQRPRLLVVPPQQPGALAQELGAPPAGGRFEWIVARQPLRGCSAQQIAAWLDALEPWLTPGGELRVLFSRPLLGPCGSLHQSQGRGQGRRRGNGAGAFGAEAFGAGATDAGAPRAWNQRANQAAGNTLNETTTETADETVTTAADAAVNTAADRAVNPAPNNTADPSLDAAVMDAAVMDAAQLDAAELDAAVIELEQRWLESEHRESQHLGELLQARGWSVGEQSWREGLSLTLAPPLLERWFASGAAYRRWLEPQIGAAALGRLQERLRQAMGSALPQPLQHTWIQARRSAAASSAGRPPTRRQKKAPD